MFLRYILNSIKKYPVKYAVIAICEVLLLVISLLSSGIFMDRLSNLENTMNYATEYPISFSKLDVVHINIDNLSEEDKEFIADDFANLPDVTKMRERISEFCEKSPIKISYVDMSLNGWEKNAYRISVLYFSSYENLLYYFNEKSYPQNILPTEQQYLDKDKVVILGMGPDHNSNGEYVYSDKNHLLVGKNDDEYLILGTTEYNNAVILFGTEPDYLKLGAVEFFFTEVPTQKQVDEFTNLFKEIVTPDIEITISRPPLIKDLLDIRKDTANIVITAALLLITSFNILAIFKYMTDECRNEYAVLRLCGYGKFTALAFPLVEIISVSAVCSVLSCVIFSLFIPLLKKNFPAVAVLFDFGFYAIFTVGFIAITAVMFAVYIAPSLNKSVSDELREM